ncbi:MinD/ParA family protein [Halonatronum saccharophilum]|uniref:MinD/ParA family protein n=1 Tax=Halonatronum saccharophilum TaxID=150060 RepID=UPI00047F5299|nr:MinD/ParA family protein [Halonatronum saccharophilum]
MNDQAHKLRSLVKSMSNNQGDNQNNDDLNKAHLYTITSGKGGVGKSNCTANLALALQEKGKRVIIFDADLGMANLDVILGVTPSYNLKHVVNGLKSLEEIIVSGPNGIALIPGGSGMQELANLSQIQINNLISSFVRIGKEYDIILVDTGAGLGNNVVDFILGSDEVILVSTPEPTSITDAYGVLKTISRYDKRININLLINQVENHREGEIVSKRLITTANDFLELEVSLLGVLPKDDSVVKSVKSRRPFLVEFPKARVSKEIRVIANKVLDQEVENGSPKGIKGFFSNLLGIGRR